MSGIVGALRRRPERGAVVIELAMVLPMLLLLALAVADLGFAFRAQLRLADAVRSGARAGALAANGADADRRTLLAIGTALDGAPDLQVDVVVVYRSTDGADVPPPACLSPSAIRLGGNAVAHCEVYTAADVAAATADAADGQLAAPPCAGRHANWCPATRDTAQAGGTVDRIGVYVRVVYDGGTRLLLRVGTLDDGVVTAVAAAEPSAPEVP